MTQEIKSQLEKAQEKRDKQRLGDLHRASLSRQNFNQSDPVYEEVAKFQAEKYKELNSQLERIKESLKNEMDEQYEDLTGQVKKISLHKLSCNKNMDYDLNFLVKQFEDFAKHNKLVGSPMDRLYNEKIDFKISFNQSENENSADAKRLKQLVKGELPKLDSNPGNFRTNDTRNDYFGDIKKQKISFVKNSFNILEL